MLLGDFFNITEIQHEDNMDLVSVSFNAAHPIFKGHFPHLPIVPGVCQLQMLEEVISHLVSSGLKVKAADQVKFLALLNPIKSPEIRMALSHSRDAAGGVQVTAKYYNDVETFFRFKGQLHNVL